VTVKNAAFVRNLQCVGNQDGPLRQKDRTAELFPPEILEDEVIGPDVVDLANVYMALRVLGSIQKKRWVHHRSIQEAYMRRVTGIGGTFFTARDTSAPRAWYKR
jgi:hypothetical protein